MHKIKYIAKVEMSICYIAGYKYMRMIAIIESITRRDNDIVH